jgi:hypothetical protein
VAVSATLSAKLNPAEPEPITKKSLFILRDDRYVLQIDCTKIVKFVENEQKVADISCLALANFANFAL